MKNFTCYPIRLWLETGRLLQGNVSIEQWKGKSKRDEVVKQKEPTLGCYNTKHKKGNQMSNTYTTEDVKQMFSILPEDFMETCILEELNCDGEPTGWAKEDRELYAIAKTFTDEFVNEMLIYNEEEHEGYNEDTDEFPDESGAKTIESYRRLINKDITKEEENLITNIGDRMLTVRYALKEENINSAFIQRIYLYAVLGGVFEKSRDLSREYLSN